MKYIENEELNRKGGMVRLNPVLVKCLKSQPPHGTEEVRVDEIFKK